MSALGAITNELREAGIDVRSMPSSAATKPHREFMTKLQASSMLADLRSVALPVRAGKHRDNTVQAVFEVIPPGPMLKAVERENPNLIWGSSTPDERRLFWQRLAQSEPWFDMHVDAEHCPCPVILYGDDAQGLAESPTLAITVRPAHPFGGDSNAPWLTRFLVALIPQRRCVHDQGVIVSVQKCSVMHVPKRKCSNNFADAACAVQLMLQVPSRTCPASYQRAEC